MPPCWAVFFLPLLKVRCYVLVSIILVSIYEEFACYHNDLRNISKEIRDHSLLGVCLDNTLTQRLEFSPPLLY